MIINISEPAKTNLNLMFDNYNLKEKNFRVYIQRISSWYGPIFYVALDEPTENDEVFTSDDYNVILNKDLCDKIEVINIFFSGGEFRVSTDLSWRDEYYGTPWTRPW